jgi:hypothetical protein
MPLIMPPAFDAVPAIIQVAAHKPAPQAPVPHPVKPSGTQPQPANTSQLPDIVGPAPAPHPFTLSGTTPQPASGSQLPDIVGKSPVTLPPPPPPAPSS